MKLNKNKILGNLLRQYKQGNINEHELKNLLVELEIMAPIKVLKTTKINARQFDFLDDKATIIIKGS